MTLPPAKDVVFSVGGSDVTFSVRVIEDVIDAAPVVQSLAPLAWEDTKLAPREYALLPIRHGFDERAVFQNAVDGKLSFICPSPPLSAGRPLYDELALPLLVEVRDREVEPQHRRTFPLDETPH